MFFPSYETMYSPNLVQRGTILDLPEDEIEGIDGLINYDYMGSAEFEFGALHFSIKRITRDWQQYEWFPIDSIVDADGRPLHVLCRTRQKAEVIDSIKIFASNPDKIRTKERVALREYLECQSEYAVRTNFWWDISSNNSRESQSGNDWMACFGANNMRRLVIGIKKVCIKFGFSDQGPSLPEKVSEKVFDLKVSDSRLVEVSWGGKLRKIDKRKVIEVQAKTDMIIVTVENRQAARFKEKVIAIPAPPSIARSLLFNILKDWPEINAQRKAHQNG